jgi:MFS family permease
MKLPVRIINLREQTEETQLRKKKIINKLSYLLISFNQGIAGISELAVNYLYKDVFKLSPANFSVISSFCSIPWIIKPFFGILTDAFPFLGYRRKTYIISCGILSLICWLVISTVIDKVYMYLCVFLLFCINSAVSFSTVLGEAVVVEISQLDKSESAHSSAKNNVSFFFLCKYVGYLLSSFCKGWLMDKLHIKGVFIVASLPPILLIASGLILIENKESHCKISLVETEIESEKNETIKFTPKNSFFKEFFSFFCQKFILIPTIFILLYYSAPSYNAAYWYFLTEKLNFNATDQGLVSVYGNIANLIAIIIYMNMKKPDFRKIIIFGSLISFFFSFIDYAVVKRWNVDYVSDFNMFIISAVFLNFLGEIVSMPMLALAANLCPKNMEGTVYSVFMSALNFGGILSGLIGSFLTFLFGITNENYAPLDTLILACNIFSLLPLLLMLIIPKNYFIPEQKKLKEAELDEVHDLTQETNEGSLN